MKTIVRVLLSIIVLALGTSLGFAQIPRTLSYQGVLTDAAGNARDGNFQFTFCLYASSTGGTSIWCEKKTLSVRKGIFSTVLGEQTPFGAAVKFDKQYWLGIQVDGESELTPRIALTSVGYSMNSLRADTAKFTLTTQGDGSWSANGPDIYRFKGNVGIGTMNPSARLEAVSDSNHVDILNLRNSNTGTSAGAGVFLYADNSLNGGLFQAGSAYSELSDLPNGGAGMLILNAGGTSNGIGLRTGHPSRPIIFTSGYVGIGTTNPSTHLNVDPKGEGYILIGNSNTTSGGFTSLSMGISAESDGYGEIQAISKSGSAYGDLLLNPRGGLVGIGGDLVWGNNSVLGTDQGGSIELGGQDGVGSRTPFIDFHSPGGAADYNVRIINDANGQLSFKAQRVVTTGRTITSVLEITGGSDLAEPFPTSEAESLPPGAVVVIDENNPGHLKLGRKPYDKGVAGIVSGAGGINPGLTLRQEGVMEGEQNIALSGRVYALATTANGPIKPGDRLTTSAVPGHCMKATDASLCDGAVIGKAMSSLETGEGLVLVLVNLQ